MHDSDHYSANWIIKIRWNDLIKFNLKFIRRIIFAFYRIRSAFLKFRLLLKYYEQLSSCFVLVNARQKDLKSLTTHFLLEYLCHFLISFLDQQIGNFFQGRQSKQILVYFKPVEQLLLAWVIIIAILSIILIANLRNIHNSGNRSQLEKRMTKSIIINSI